jgi:hypothetical protein
LRSVPRTAADGNHPPAPGQREAGAPRHGCQSPPGSGRGNRRLAPPVESKSLLEYIETLAVNPKHRDLHYFFRHLDHPDPAIADDALLEFVHADYRDVFPLAKNWPAGQLTECLKKPNLPPARVRLYATLVGDCGTEQHARQLRQKVQSPLDSPGSDGLLVGYTLLQPPEGRELLSGILKDSNKGFIERFTCLTALRFLHDFRPDRVNRAQFVDLLSPLLNQENIVDIAVEDLRRRGCSAPLDRVLAAYRDKAPPIVRHAVIRNALSFPGDSLAAEFVQRMRRQDPERVRDIADSLEFERDSPRQITSPAQRIR